MPPKRALAHGADPFHRPQRGRIAGVGLELHAFGAERCEGVAEEEELAFGVAARALPARSKKCPADLDAGVLALDTASIRRLPSPAPRSRRAARGRPPPRPWPSR
jgi:hypothetical protein